jgi:ParB family chromosome partitioning protein
VGVHFGFMAGRRLIFRLIEHDDKVSSAAQGAFILGCSRVCGDLVFTTKETPVMSKQLPMKSRLGRGLSSLMNTSLPDDEPAPAAASGAFAGRSDAPLGIRVLDVPVDQLLPNPHQPRRVFNETALAELAGSMRSTGVIQPVVARVTGEGRYELIAGERRWRAARLAGLAVLPVIVREADPVMQAQMALIENVQRENLNPIERAEAYKALLENLGLTQLELADRLGEERTVISHHLRLIELPKSVQDMVGDQRLSLGHAKVLAGLADPLEQVRLAELAVAQGLNVRNLERLIQTPTAPPPGGKSAVSPSAHLADLEKNLSRHLGMRVQVKAVAGKKKGRLVVHFASLDQFDDLLARLGISPE